MAKEVMDFHIIYIIECVWVSVYVGMFVCIGYKYTSTKTNTIIFYDHKIQLK